MDEFVVLDVDVEYSLLDDSTTSIGTSLDVEAKRKKAKSQPKPKMNSINPCQLIEMWVDIKTNKDSVRFYKPLDVESEKYPDIEADKYLVMLMTKAQMDFLKKFSKTLVCIDQQSGENFNLLALLVLDDKEQCLPCAFLFTNEMDPTVANVFFSEIKSAVGSLSTNLVLADNDIVSNAWNQVMGHCEKHMLCSWDVVRDWEFNLLELVNFKKQTTIIKELEKIVSEKDINGFTTLYQTLLGGLKNDVETEEFANYIHEYYSNCPQSWASCYRFEEESHVGYLELNKVHAALEFILKSKPTKFIDKALSATIEFLRTKIYDRLMIRSEGRVSSKLYELRDKHKKAEKMAGQITSDDDCWLVENGKKDKHIVKISYRDCPCHLKCQVCNTCAHAFRCTCADSILKLNMCLHIHYVCMYDKDAVGINAVTDGFESPANSAVNIIKNSVERQVHSSAENNMNSPKTQVQPVKINKKLPSKTTSFENKVNESRSLQKEKIETSKLLKKQIVCVNESSTKQVYQSTVDKQSVQFEEESENPELEVEIVAEDNNVTDVQVLLCQETPTSSQNSIEIRKNNVEHTFKSILSFVKNEEQLVLIENAVSSLQTKVVSSNKSDDTSKTCNTKNGPTHVTPGSKNDRTLKRKINSKFVNTSSPPPLAPFKIFKICDLSGKPLTLGKSVVGQPVTLKFGE